MYSARPGGSSSGPGRARWRGGALLPVLLVVGLVAAARPASGQRVGRFTGVAVGRTSSEQLWSQPVETSRRSGVLISVFFDVPSALPVLRLRVEAGYTQRGGLVSSDFQGNPLDGQVRSDYLSFHVETKVNGSAGPFHLFAAAGPGFDQLVQSRKDPVLEQVLANEHETVFNFAGAAGAGVRLGDIWLAEVEARWVEGLSSAYSGSFLKVRNRSVEWVLRVSRVNE